MKERTLLIVDDDSKMRRMLCDFLKGCGYKVVEGINGEKALEIFYANNSKIDCIILDVMMPKIDGMQVLAEIREQSLVPIIMLTAKGAEYDQLECFRAGADDYICKPFSLTLLMARLEAVLKRCYKDEKDIIVAGDLKIDNHKKEVTISDKPVVLTPKEYEILMYFVINKGVTLSREQLLNGVWNYDYCGDSRTVDTHIKQLRAKLSDCGDYIKTIYGFGYKFEVENSHAV